MLQIQSDTVTHYTDYPCLEWSIINIFWYQYGKYISIADEGNHN